MQDHSVDKNYRHYMVNKKGQKKDGVKWMHSVCQSRIFLREIFRALSNIYDRAKIVNGWKLKAVNYIRKKLYRRCLIEFWIRFCFLLIWNMHLYAWKEFFLIPFGLDFEKSKTKLTDWLNSRKYKTELTHINLSW